MDDWRVITALAALLYILLAYIIEVILGSSSTLYNGELGMNDTRDEVQRLSQREFFGRYLPMLLGVFALLLLTARIR
jgi:hypothetical protein